MATAWYSITVDGGREYSGTLFTGYFKTENSQITGFYETYNGSTDFDSSILLAAGSRLTPFGNPSDYNDNIYNGNGKFTNTGVAISLPNNTSYSSLTLHYTPSSLLMGFPVPESSVIFYLRSGLGYSGTNGASYTITSVSDPSCFNEGTNILCLNKQFQEEYIPIETLRSGDLVKTFKHGYRKIDLIGKNTLINNPSKFNECMFKMEKTDSNGLIEDLIVTGGHSILVDDLGEYKEENEKLLGTQIIDNKYLFLAALSSDFSKIETVNVYTYYHFILENNGNDEERFGVWANGVLTETPSKKGFIDCKDKFLLL